MTQQQKRQAKAAAAVALLLLLAWRLAHAKPIPKISDGPITVKDTEESSVELLRQKRAALRYRVLDLIAWNQDAAKPTRRPTPADNLILNSIVQELGKLANQIPDPTPEKFDTAFDQELTAAIEKARLLDPSTSGNPTGEFGSAIYITRLVNIEKAIADAVAMDENGQPQRRPSPGELATANLLVLEANDLRQKILAYGPVADEGGIDLEAILAAASELPASTTALAAHSIYRGAVA